MAVLGVRLPQQHRGTALKARAVSMIPTTEVEARHSIPGCSYSIHSSSIDELDAGKPAGPPIQFARVGDRVLHQWHCDDEMFGILINNCYVTDGFGKRADVVDSKGCSVDAILITGIRYSPDLQRAYAESQVFKFADRPGVWFFCQIQMCMKKAGMCNGVTPPSCASSATGATEEEAMSVNEDFEAEMKSNVLGKGSDKATMNLPKHNDHMKLPFGQQEGPRRTTEPFQYTGSASYGITETAEDYDMMKEHVTVFGPGFPLPNALEKDGIHYGPAHKAILGNAIPTTERPQNSMAVVTTVFEADEAYAATSGRVNAKGAYADYDEEEVTIPANLNDLLANLPDDFSADSLQKMFRDSVEDRRALLQGFDMLMNQDSWRSRMADAPLGKVEDDERFANRHHVNAVEEPPFDPDAPPMIAGRLLIYDLDEEPPNTAIKTNRDEQQSSPKSCAPSGCAISRHGLFVLASGLGTFCAVLLVVTVFMYARLSRTLMFPRELAYESSASPPSKPVNNELSGGSIASGIQRNRLRAPDWNLEN
ncbi:Cuticlin-1 [Toxocara canis]|uniref:Cuticlin-1 n=1 Tax=Toxocara canis TaxID=6265 RepID=A0A0B2W1R1_TOXCA|nr:Cuticlin-1 [Toxocara canis]